MCQSGTIMIEICNDLVLTISDEIRTACRRRCARHVTITNFSNLHVTAAVRSVILIRTGVVPVESLIQGNNFLQHVSMRVGKSRDSAQEPTVTYR